MPKSLLYNKTI
ncbi:uncharacterized protein FFNC_15685 [Fusarium fujikuroi]|nr:uncharacterized protein FFE2_16065 [Fusarium fujikuroi]SCO27087.1 uncharacterized protein FFM5_15356 [Fusarium fujikuroi]SCO54900.1 uncharacterized protein FFNC_15685 [Fusarium fujikuroi]